MKFLFNSQGQHIANEVNGQLHSRAGINIGHYLSGPGIFIDRRGYYLGAIVLENRLMRNPSSPHRSSSFGVHGDHGSVGSYGNAGNCASVGVVSGYDDVPLSLLD
jgi:hypothetical protein